MATTNSTGEKGGLLDEIINSMDKTQGVVRSKKDTAKPNKGKDVSSTGTETKKNDKMDIGRGHVHVSQKASSDTGRSHGLHKPSSSKSSSTSSKIPTGTKIITSAAKVSDNNSQTAGPSSTAEFVAPNFSGSQLTPLGVETQLNAFMQAMTLQNQAVMGYMSKMDAFMSSFAPASDLADAQNYETGSEEDEADNNEQMDADKSEEATGAINTDDVDELLHDAKAAHQQDYEKEELGPAINASLAQMAEDMLKTNLTSEQCKTKTEAIKRPSNLPHLMPPRVNEEIWKMEEVSTACRKADIRHQHTQDLLTKSTVNMYMNTW